MTIPAGSWGNDGSSSVVSLARRQQARKEAQAERRARHLLLDARAAIDDALAGDFDAAHDVVWAGIRATQVIDEHRLGATGWTRHAAGDGPPWSAA